MKSTNKITYFDEELVHFSPADVVPSCMQITPDATGVTLMESNPYLGALKVVEDMQEPVLAYDDYQLIQSRNMLVVTEAKFIPDMTAFRPANMQGMIEPLQADRDYKIMIGEQAETLILFKNDHDHVTLSIEAKRVVMFSSTSLPVTLNDFNKIENLVIRVTANTVQLLKINDKTVHAQAYQLDKYFDHVLLEAAELPYDLSNVFIQLGWANQLTNAPFLSAYFQACQGKFSLSNSNAPHHAFMIAGLALQPEKKRIADQVKQGFVIYTLFVGEKFTVILGDYGSMDNVTFMQDEPSLNPVVTFEITGNHSMNVYIDGKMVGSWVSSHGLELPEFYQVIALDGLTQLDFDLREAYAAVGEEIYAVNTNNAKTYDSVHKYKVSPKRMRTGHYLPFYHSQRLPLYPL
ncbi:hypothetical protein [Acinetobacter vivianii]|uniref:hypothetical protein n=1 Tax=Acinetobacter vivianii TaxID=1776742 RepID=UPI002DB86D78|nr:hypothetical protein [Acinetobacter vivianii]MEB6478587.1 hypothetical protein [Acinetobacter vivianii]MEB6657582.1 hypothetical protein [Acinetobacter vivianii]